LNPRIPDSEFLQRIETTRKEMEKRSLDFLVAFSSYPEREGHIGYLTNYHGAFPPSQHDDTYRGLGYGALVLSKPSGPVLFSGILFASGRLVGVQRVDTSSNLPLAVADFISESILTDGKGVASIGFVGIDVFPSLYLEELKAKLLKKFSRPNLGFADVESILLGQRQIKSPAERRVLQRAAKIADKGIQAAFEATVPGVRESEIALAASRVCYEEGTDYVARTRIYGRNVSGVRWPILSNRKLAKGEITGIDLVGSYNNYGFDVLRMWTVGKPTPAQKQSLGDAATLTEVTEKRIRAGMNGDQVSKLTMEVASEMKLGGKPSPFGHAIGMEIVENPILLPESNVAISAGAVLCIEPGLELSNHQTIHFEDEIFVGQNGSPKIMSECPKDFS
jgi:Xaa-Pro aminopeptidase